MRNAYITSSATGSNTSNTPALIDGRSLPIGSYAIFVDGPNGVTLELFKDGVSFIAKRTENAPPLAVGGDDNGKLRLKDFPAGAYRLTISGQPDINFTVGTTTPPDPLDPIKEPMHIENGTTLLIETVSGKKYRAPVSKV